MNKLFLIIILFLLISLTAFAQPLSLSKTIKIAQENSLDVLLAKNRFLASYWKYKNFKGSMLPQLSFNGDLPTIVQGFKPYITESGAQEYVKQSYISYSGTLSLRQKIGLTGGDIFLSSGLQRTSNFGSSNPSYVSTPINIGLRQPLFNFNKYKWDKKIEPLEYKKAKQEYLSAIEQVSMSAINYFFALLTTEKQLKIAELRVSNYDTLYKIAKNRYQLGKIAENDLLQLELSLLNSKSQLEKARLMLENESFRFKSFLRLNPETTVTLEVPEAANSSVVLYEKALQLASLNNTKIVDFEKRLLQAESNLTQAKKANGFNADLYAVFGLNQRAPLLAEAYQTPEAQQEVSVGLSVPILDWGLRRGKVKIAESEYEIVEKSIEQEKVDFKLQVYSEVADFNMQKNQLFIAAKSDTVAQRSYMVTKNRYYLGKITVTDLNIAQENMDGANINYLKSLQRFWISYYTLRRTTLYDFVEDKAIEVDFEEIYK